MRLHKICIFIDPYPVVPFARLHAEQRQRELSNSTDAQRRYDKLATTEPMDR